VNKGKGEDNNNKQTNKNKTKQKQTDKQTKRQQVITRFLVLVLKTTFESRESTTVSASVSSCHAVVYQ